MCDFGINHPCFLATNQAGRKCRKENKKMFLGGIQKNSFIDFPGKVSAVLFLSGCNFRCPYCHNPELVKDRTHCPAFLNETWVLEFLKKRKGFLDGVVISGGEPTIHDDLFALCDKLKASGFPIKIDTNGSRPEVIQKLINGGLVDYIAMDIKTDPLKYLSFTNTGFNPNSILKSIQIIMESSIDYEFRTTCIKPLVNENVIQTISRLIDGSMLYALQHFRDGKVLQPEFFRCNTDAIGLSDPEMALMQSIAKPWVQSCIVR
jgi:pyruvate formate lyase activating enzyme